jgi:hypothetical protein
VRCVSTSDNVRWKRPSIARRYTYQAVTACAIVVSVPRPVMPALQQRCTKP